MVALVVQVMHLSLGRPLHRIDGNEEVIDIAIDIEVGSAHTMGANDGFDIDIGQWVCQSMTIDFLTSPSIRQMIAINANEWPLNQC